MRKRNIVAAMFMLCMSLGASAAPAANDDAKMNKFIDDLMSKMTVEEKNRTTQPACYGRHRDWSGKE